MSTSDSRSPGSGRPSSFDQDFEEVTAISGPPTLSAPRTVQPTQTARRATITVMSGPNAGAIFPLLLDESVIGRGRECAVRIDDPGMSRKHARIVRRGPQHYVIEDLDSRNGTFVRGKRASSQPLAEGERIALGATLEVRFGFTDETEENLLRRLYESSVSDPLTGAYNRKHFSERLAAELAYAKRHGTPLCVLLFDLDYFKKINDTFGHPAGDYVLSSVAGLVKRTLRAEDVFARYGGEEFAVIARGIDVDRGYRFGERVRSIVERAKMVFNEERLSVTISVGVASLTCCGEPTVEALVAKADERLYAAKHAGRNRTVGGPRS